MTAKEAAARLYRKELRVVGERWGVDPIVVRAPEYRGPHKFAEMKRLITLAFLAGRYGEARRWAAYSYPDHLRIVREASTSIKGWPSAGAVMDDSSRAGAIAVSCERAPLLWMAASRDSPAAPDRALMKEGIRFHQDAKNHRLALVKSSEPEEDDYPGNRIDGVRTLFEGIRLPALVLDDLRTLRACEGLREAGRLNFQERPGVAMDGAARLFALFDAAHTALDDGDPERVGKAHAALYDHVRQTAEKPYDLRLLFAQLPLVLLGSMRAKGPVRYPPASSLADFSGKDYWAD